MRITSCQCLCWRKGYARVTSALASACIIACSELERGHAIKLFGTYRLGFDVWGLVLFVVVMLPNFLWFAVPAPNDVLRAESVTAVVDTIASIAQVVMVAALCFLINEERVLPMPRGCFWTTIAFVVLYFLGWIFYYLGIANTPIVLDLAIAPCAAFVAFSLGRKNSIALTAAIVFFACHLVFAFVNFII